MHSGYHPNEMRMVSNQKQSLGGDVDVPDKGLLELRDLLFIYDSQVHFYLYLELCKHEESAFA
jgi:hypothetical protein